jgi:serine/threonine protein kinase
MHRDIKTDNILLHDGEVRVADFGLAKLVDILDKYVKSDHTKSVGTPLYMSPQVLNGEEYSCKCDVWSTGFMLYELLTTKCPWQGVSPKKLYENIIQKPLTLPSKIDVDTENLLRKMLAIKEEDRLSWPEVYSHPALDFIDLDED